MNETLVRIKEFHGHLGPYAALGYRMGLIANKRFGPDPFGKKARALTGTVTPVSCMIDGVQLSSCCTLGKGNIEVAEEGTPKVIFTDKEGINTLAISVKSGILDRIRGEMTWESGEQLAIELFELPDDELFDIEEN